MNFVLPSSSSSALTLTRLIFRQLSKQFHSSPILLNRRNKKIQQHFILKKIESKKPVAHLFEGISSAVGKDIDSLIDVITQVASEKLTDEIICNPEAPLRRELILDVISYLKMRPVWVAPPTNEEVIDETEFQLFPQPPPPLSDLQKRAPIVAIMGHVDHGKTTLLDSLRRSNIVAQEFGGITQHIGAFSVKLPSLGNIPVTFLDTPGHSAFKAMRQRGAQATDLVVLVVAADDSVMEQTIDSIKYAKEASVPIIVAINKCDKPTAQPEQVLNDLLKYDLIPEQFGGDVQVVNISALNGQGIDDLLEAILLQSEIMQLKSTCKGLVEATVVESTNLPDVGLVATAIINRGTLRPGKILVCGTCWGQVKTLSNEFDKYLDEAGPSTPVRISGWKDELPSPGELAIEVTDLSKAKKIVEYRRKKKMETMFIDDMEIVERRRAEAREKHRQKKLELVEQGIVIKTGNTTPDAYTKPTEEEFAALQVPSLTIIIRCDVDGALEALKNVLSTYSANNQVRLKIANSNVGPLTEKDLELAGAIGAYILSFNAPIDQQIKELAKKKGVPFEEFHVIYKFVERLKELLTEKIAPVIERRLVGGGTVIRAYKLKDGLKKKQPVAGIRVDWGKMDRKFIWRFVRSGNSLSEEDSLTLYEGSIMSMECEGQSISQATTEMQIGVAISDKNITYKEDDRVDVFEDVQIPQQINWNPPGF